MSIAKVIVVGSPRGEHSTFVNTISKVRIRSSANTPTGDAFVPLDFGKLSIDSDLDLHIFGVERDRVGVIADALAPGIVGAILLLNSTDLQDSHFTVQAINDLLDRGVTVLFARTSEIDDKETRPIFEASPGSKLIECAPHERESVKDALIAALQAAIEAVESNAA